MPVLQEACDQLIGAGRWWRRAGIGGSIPVRFPSEADPGDAGWHIEASYEDGGQWRVNVGSRARGLLALYLLTDVDPDGAPTRLRPGSHRDVPPILASAGMTEWSGCPRPSRPRRPVRTARGLAAGEAGDVFLCHPFLVHAASWPHRGHLPRMIAQPGVALHGQYALRAVPGETPPPVQRVILDSLAAVAR
jgi:hypothetical protein